MNYLGPELAQFSDQIDFAIKNYHQHGKKISDFNHIVISGLGGSGIAGKIIKSYYLNKIDIPIETVSDYQLPKFVNEKTLVILCSYSGNTEETISAFTDAQLKGATCLVLTVGGKIAELADTNNVPIYRAVAGFQPRVAFGYPITYLFLIFSELLGLNEATDITSISKVVSKSEDFKTRSLSIKEQFNDSIRNKYIIVASPDMEAMGIRFAQQIQENAKLEAFVVVIPEANHNVIETYYQKWDSNYILLNSGSNQQINLRFHFVKELLNSYNAKVCELETKAATMAHIYDTVYLLDWVSLQIAHEVGAVSNQIKNIIDLKNFLNK